mmetsp:Transcript_5093/g.8810  ORF Transcript_5093/g.8810 Transcript_5093/m.8810 type:complete len:232 (+) Transcript_5093:923-1618(+)
MPGLANGPMEISCGGGGSSSSNPARSKRMSGSISESTTLEPEETVPPDVSVPGTRDGTLSDSLLEVRRCLPPLPLSLPALDAGEGLTSRELLLDRLEDLDLTPMGVPDPRSRAGTRSVWRCRGAASSSASSKSSSSSSSPVLKVSSQTPVAASVSPAVESSASSFAGASLGAPRAASVAAAVGGGFSSVCVMVMFSLWNFCSRVTLFAPFGSVAAAACFLVCFPRGRKGRS